MDDFQIFVKPVGANCNLSCKYCYYLGKQEFCESDRLRMPDHILTEYILKHAQASQGPEIFFSWHGGEPLMAGLSYFKKIIALQRKLIPPNYRIINGIQTNGTLLTEEWCSFMKKENFIVGISIDGPDIFHSANRIRKDGTTCFGAVINGYNLLKKFGIPNEILCVVHSANVNYPLDIYHYFKKLGSEMITFLPLVEKINQPDTYVSARSVDPEGFGEFLCVIFDEWKDSDIGTIRIEIFEEALRTAFNQEHTVCIFKKTCGRVPVLEHNGNLYSCDHFVDGQHLLGNIMNSPISVLLEKQVQRKFGQDKMDNLPGYCRKCEVLNMCNGGCPKDRFAYTPDGESGLNYLCKGYKRFFTHCKPFVDQVSSVWRAGTK